MRKLRDWFLIAALTIAGGWGLGRAGLPSGYLYTSMVAGLAFALVRPGRLSLPPLGFRVGQAITGVALGTFLHSSTIRELGDRWLPVVLVSVATLVVSILAGLALARAARVDRATASLGMVAGGASGMVAMADDLGADDLGADEQLVGFMQYLRVLAITLITPLLVPLAFGVHPEGGGQGDGPLLGTAGGWALTIGAALAGAAIGPRLRFPAPALFGPLLLTAGLSVAGLTGGAEVPPVAREVGFALIGVQIGLGFERDTVRQIARLALPVAATITALLVACFALGWALKLTADVTLLDGYLATTPGGFPAVLPIAYGSGADVAFVLSVQSLRLLAMVLAAPLVVRRLLRTAARSDERPAVPPIGGTPGRSMREDAAGGPDYEAMAEIEEHDVDDMLEAISERRRRRGARDVGDELADELIRGTWEESD